MEKIPKFKKCLNKELALSPAQDYLENNQFKFTGLVKENSDKCVSCTNDNDCKKLILFLKSPLDNKLIVFNEFIFVNPAF